MPKSSRVCQRPVPSLAGHVRSWLSNLDHSGGTKVHAGAGCAAASRVVQVVTDMPRYRTYHRLCAAKSIMLTCPVVRIYDGPVQ